MVISAIEFIANFDKYIKLAQKEDVEITNNGIVVGVFSSPLAKDVKAICGVLNGKNYDKKQLRSFNAKEKLDKIN